VAKIDEIQREEIQEAIDEIMWVAAIDEIRAKKETTSEDEEKEKVQEVHQKATQELRDKFPHIDFGEDFDIFTAQL